MVTQTPVKETLIAPQAHAQILRNTEPLHISMTLYVIGSNQEFAIRGDTKQATNNWADVWGNGRIEYKKATNNWADVWQNGRIEPRLSVVNPAKETLSDIIKIRADGFVTDRANGRVFYADAETISNLTALASTTIAEIYNKHPEVLEALKL